VILIDLNQSEVTLQVYAMNPDGSQKLDVTSGTVRVYYMNAGVEQEVLAATPLVQVGATNVWRYTWNPASLPVREYVAEYKINDVVRSAKISEDVVVRDIATQTDLLIIKADVELIKKVETGRWKIESNQMTFYDDDGVTPLLVYNLYDDAGVPSMTDVFERREP